MSARMSVDGGSRWPAARGAGSVTAAVPAGGDVSWALPPRTAGGAAARVRTDRALVRAAQHGDAQALERLYRAHWDMAHRAAYLVVHDAAAAEDIAQESFLAALRALDRFDRRRPFGPWLHRIVVNRAIDHARSRSLRREVDAERVPEPAAMPVDAGVFSDSTLAALAALPPDHRGVVVLRHLLEYTPGEIAAMLGLPRGTVNSRLRRGLDEMASQLEGQRT
jgi:RNA polymerase sigma-70 factor (ECF subfamily)